MTTRAWIGLIVAVCLAFAGWWMLDTFTFQEFRFPGKPSPEVLRNPYYVLEKVLRQQGVQVESRYGHRGPPPGSAKGAVLFLPIERRTLGQTRAEDLLTWVRAGGHLIVIGKDESMSLRKTGRNTRPRSPAAKTDGDDQAKNLHAVQRDHILEEVDVRAETIRSKRPYSQKTPQESGVPLPGDDDEAAANEGDDFPGFSGYGFRPGNSASSADCAPHSEVGTEAQRFPAQWMRLCFPAETRLVSTSEPLWAARTQSGDHVVSHALGQGRVSVLTSPVPLHNWALDIGDHADFLAALLGGELRGLRMTIVLRDDVDNLAVLAWEHAGGVVISLSALILFWLWASAVRLGPISSPAVPERRSVLEHVLALGEFFWREKRPHLLWQATAERTRKELVRKVPRFATDALLAAHLARRTGLAEPDLLFALNPGDVAEPQDFVRAIATLEQLRKSL